MNIFKHNLVGKGLFALAAVVAVSSTTAVYAATNNTSNVTSGYGTPGEEAIAAADKLIDEYNADTSDFEAKVDAAIAQAKSRLQTGGGNVDNFDSAFNEATDDYDQAVSEAASAFSASVANAASTAESKNQFIDAYNRAKANYFNQLDAAKNELAAKLSPLGDNGNQAKDGFMNAFNSARDMYGNELEAAKNELAATLG